MEDTATFGHRVARRSGGWRGGTVADEYTPMRNEERDQIWCLGISFGRS